MSFLTTLRIPAMDCHAEANVVEMKLKSTAGIGRLDFDLARRTLTVRHRAPLEEILGAIHGLGFSAETLASETAEWEEPGEASSLHAKVLWIVLAINLAFFVIEAAAGFLARSMGLAADSLDMLADALVYGLSLYAVGHAAMRKPVAAIAAYLQFVLACLGLFEVLRRFFHPGEAPDVRAMIAVSALALAANAYTLWLLDKAKTGEAHIRASVICTSNDVITNAGIIVAGLLVLFTGSALPDLAVGLVVFVLVARGGFAMLALSR